MAATPISASTRFFHRGKTKVYYCSSLTLASPTRLELNAGTDLSDEIAELNGWEITSGEIEVPDLGSVFTGKIGGSLEIGDSAISLYASRNGSDVRSLLPRDTEGYVVICDGGDVAGYKGDAFPVRVRSNGKPRDMGDVAALVVVSFSITGEPTENFTIPA